MMPIINGVMLAVSGSPAASIVVKATLAIALALIGARLARGSRAAVRHALIAAAFAVLLTLPVASIFAPPVGIAAPAAHEPVVPAAATGAIPAGEPRETVYVTSADRQPAGMSLSTLLLTVWIAGMAFFLLPVAMGLWQVRRLRRSALPWRHGQSTADELALEAGFHRRVEVLLHGTLPGPMTCGVVHPAIVLPEDAQAWEAEELNRALVHELEHVRRGDWVTHCLARAVCAAYWFHPLVWMARRRLTLEAERSCDDAVLERSEATAYAEQLVGLARRLSTAAKSPALAMANHADLSTRVGALLDGRQKRGRAGKFAVAAACAAAVLVLATAPLRVVAAQQSAGSDVGVVSAARFRASTGLVIETVIVTDSNGKAIEGLGANDFALTEDGVPQKIDVFEFQKLVAAPPDTRGSVQSYYILGYYVPNEPVVDGQLRKVAVTCRDAAATLDYRPGYYPDKRFTAFTGKVSSGTESSVAQPNPTPGVTPPRSIYTVEPDYSLEARKAKFQGTVILSVEVSASGEVTDAKVKKSLGLGLNEKAIDAIKQWKFTPGTKDGKPVSMWVEVEMNFRLL